MRSRRPELSRRAVLGLAGGALLSGCLPGKRRAQPSAGPDPDLGIAAASRGDELALIAAYDGAIATFPTLAARLAPVREHHQQHLAALPRDRQGSSPVAVPGATSSGMAATLTSLVAAERAAAAARIVDCVAASSRLAALLASIGASEAAHASALAAGAVLR